jgi:hypothetical protein
VNKRASETLCQEIKNQPRPEIYFVSVFVLCLDCHRVQSIRVTIVRASTRASQSIDFHTSGAFFKQFVFALAVHQR